MIGAVAAAMLLAAAPSEDVGRCFFMLHQADGGYGLLTSATLARDLRTPSKKLPNRPEGLVLVQCARSSVSVADGDERVLLEYGVPLYIQDGKRVMVLELDQGRVRVRFEAGEPTEAEIPALQAAINDLQRKVNAAP